jgi:hypothetical protein
VSGKLFHPPTPLCPIPSWRVLSLKRPRTKRAYTIKEPRRIVDFAPRTSSFSRHETSPLPPSDLLVGLLIMNKLANMRQHWPNMGPGFSMSRPNNMNMTSTAPQHKATHGSPISSPSSADSTIYYSFNVPFASDLAGPNTEDILYATKDAISKWTHPEDAPDDVPIYELPIHAHNVMTLRKLCKDISSSGLPIEATVKSSEPKRVKGQVTNVCLSGSPELVHKSRETILNDTPLALVRK